MSRIAGIIHPSPFQIPELMGMLNAVFTKSDPLQVTRYKNLELAGQRDQLAFNGKKTVRGFLDGKILNSNALRNDLKRNFGIHFSTQTDAEVMVHSYDIWGDDFLKRLEGPFALALFDEEKETLLIARDRIGQKPLYWTAHGNYWLFATEIKSILATGIVPQTPSNEALAAFFYFGFSPQDHSVIQGVNKLLPGHFLKIDLRRHITISQFWSLSQELEHKKKLTEEESLEKFGSLLEEAIRQPQSDSETVASLLFGNLGSSTLNWFLTHEKSRDQIESISAFFAEPHLTELKKTQEISSLLSLANTHELIQPEDVLNELPQIIWHLDEPVADPYVVQTWHTAKMSAARRKGIKLIYTDLGWEELLAGNSRYFRAEKGKTAKPLAFHLARISPKIRDRLLIPLLHKLKSRYLYEILRHIDLNSHQFSYLMGTALFKERPRKKISPTLYSYFDPAVFAQRFHRLSPSLNPIEASLYYDIKTELPDQKLFQFDRLTKAFNLQVVSPYLNEKLINFLAEVPSNIKFSQQEPAPFLRRLMQKLCHQCPTFPEQKDSFLDSWRLNPRFRHLFGKLTQGRLVDEGLISPRWIRQQLGYPYLIPENFRQLWGILVLEIWFRLFINRPLDENLSTLSVEELLQ